MTRHIKRTSWLLVAAVVGLAAYVTFFHADWLVEPPIAAALSSDQSYTPCSGQDTTGPCTTVTCPDPQDQLVAVSDGQPICYHETYLASPVPNTDDLYGCPYNYNIGTTSPQCVPPTPTVQPAPQSSCTNPESN